MRLPAKSLHSQADRQVSATRRRLLKLTASYGLLAPFLLGTARNSYAELINVKSAVVRQSDEAYVLDAEFDFSLTTPLENALIRGTPLYFVLESEITRSRSFWFDETIATTPSVRRITYVPLTSSYRVDSGGTVGGGAAFTTLDDAMRQIRVIRNRALADRASIRSGQRYDVSLRLRLDTTQLPKPLQVNTLVSREWTLASEWYRVVLTP